MQTYFTNALARARTIGIMVRAKKVPKLLAATINVFCLGGLGRILGLSGAKPLLQVRPEIIYRTGRQSKNGKSLPDGIEVRFGQKNIPLPEVRQKLKQYGFQWSEKQKMWYAVDDAKTRAFADQFATEIVFATEATAEKNYTWLKVKDLQYVPKTANIRVQLDGKPVYINNKAELIKSYSNYSSLIADGRVSFKKFWQSKEDAMDPEDNNPAPALPSDNGEDDLELIRIRARARARALQLQLELAQKNNVSGLDGNRRRYLSYGGLTWVQLPEGTILGPFKSKAEAERKSR